MFEITPANNSRKQIGCLIMHTVHYTPVDNVYESVTEHKSEKSYSAKDDDNGLKHLKKAVSDCLNDSIINNAVKAMATVKVIAVYICKLLLVLNTDDCQSLIAPSSYGTSISYI